VDRAVQERLENLSRTVRLPGFRPGHIPDAVLKERYGAQARSHALNRLAAEAMDRALPKGSIASAIERKGGAQSGDLEMRVSATHLPDLPPVDFSEVTLERLTAEDATLQAAGVTPEAATAMFRDHLKAQVLDRLDSAYRFPVLPSLVEREFAVIWKAAQSEAEIPADAQAQASSQLRAIAERRLRLGLVVTEMARRFEIRSGQGSELEDQVIDRLLAQAPVQEHALTEQELREMLKA
jgi:FKBP-type peptidyl-prolyl cis-trans isomerase (trigger factor)